MKILAYVHAYVGMGRNAGGETTLHDALVHLKGLGHDVEVLIGEATDVAPYEVDGIPVHTTNSRALVKAGPFNYFPHYDLILTHLALTHRANLVARTLRKPVVHYLHNSHPLTTKWLREAHAAIYNAEHTRRSMQSAGVYTPGPTVHPAVDPERYRTSRRGAQSVTLVNLSGGEKYDYDKGPELFFELARRNPKVKFLGVEGGYGEQRKVDLPNVTYMPNQEDMREVYKKTRVVLMPSKIETYGRVAVEAAASGIPSIVTPTPGLQEALGESALYAPFGEVDEWDERLHELLDPETYKVQSERAKERSEFLWRRTQAELDELGVMFEIISTAGFREYYDYASVPIP